jgi:archaetidylinositol phosphate synthase
VIGFLFALAAGTLYAVRPSMPYLAALTIIASGVMDVVDGAVARAMNRVSKSGSFIDSTLDRLAEIAIYAGIVYATYTSGVIVLITLGFSLLVSYTRAKGDALSVTLSGIGIGERAERLIVLVVFSVAGFVAYGVYVVLVLAIVTFIQRYVFILRKLRAQIDS